MNKQNIIGIENSKPRGLVFFRLILLFVFMLFPGRLLASDPFQFWLKGSLVAKAAKHISVKAEIMSRVDDHGNFFYEDNDIGIAYTGLATWLDLGVYYKTIFRKLDIPDQEDVWQHEKRPHLNATARFKLFGLAFSDRVQVEYNSLEDLGNYGTFRNKIAFNPPFYLDPVRERTVIKDTKIRPFASYEIFITSENGVSKHRFQAGATLRLSERIFSDLYYTREENNTFDSGTNIAGLTFKLLF